MKLRVYLVCLSLTTLSISSYPQTSQANTPRAWNVASIASVGEDEMQGLFGSRNFAAVSDLNWSYRITPTELGKTFISGQPWIYYAIPACTESILIGCIEKVEYRKSSQEWLRATLSTREISKRNGEVSPSGRTGGGEVTSTREIFEGPADIEDYAPAAGRASYWKFGQAPHGGGDEYLLRANIAGVNSGAATWSNGKVQRYLEMGIFPVDGFTEFDFPDDLQIKIRLKLGPIAKNLWGWFDGRVINPNVTLDVDSADGIVEISGAPSKTPMGLTPKKKVSEMGSEVLDIFYCPAGFLPSACPSKFGLKWISTDGNSDINFMTKFEKEFGTLVTTGVKSEWWIKTTRWPSVATIKDCPIEQNGFVGIVTTNATMYGTAAPKWDPSDKTFSFQVASPHLGLDGSPNKGYYSLVLPKSLAECRWGKDISQAKIMVSITSSDGNTNVGTSTYSIKDNFLTFIVSGFTFSTPTIKIGLAVAQTPTVTPTATVSARPTITSAPRPAVVKKITKFCVKGKMIKKVVAVKPTCPAGYREK
jgi:hypothetical protein